MDPLTPEQRHICMLHNKSKGTKPELLVRRYLWQNGYRYRLNVKSVPGSPDIVLRRYRTAIFVNGCFWHGHEGCSKYRIPKTNTDFWQRKIARNQARDIRNRDILTENGWQVITIWECELSPSRVDDTMKRVEIRINANYIRLFQSPQPSAPDTYAIAAEPEEKFGGR